MIMCCKRGADEMPEALNNVTGKIHVGRTMNGVRGHLTDLSGQVTGVRGQLRLLTPMHRMLRAILATYPLPALGDENLASQES